MFNLLKSLPASFDRWKDLDRIASSEHLYQGPSVGEIRTLKQWLSTYSRWLSGYDEFLKAAGSYSDDGCFSDDFDRRQYEHYLALLLQSGQWHAILLKLLVNIQDSERSKYLAEIDGILSEVRKGLPCPKPACSYTDCLGSFVGELDARAAWP